MVPQPDLRDTSALVRSLDSPLRLRLVSVLMEQPTTPISLEELVLKSSRHVQDVKACLLPTVKAGVVEELDDASAFRLAPSLPASVVEALRVGIQERSALLGREQWVREHVLAGMIGINPKMQLVFEMIRQICRIDVPVLITGETGTGKELVARAIHDLGSRQQQFFGAVNCAALTEDLFESQIFGHARGAFTGAVRDHVGLIERCDGGTLFLDEIGDLSLNNQVKLLRVLQERSFSRLGEGEVRHSEFRLVAATNRDLARMISAKAFREDLFYRINVFPIRIPSLRERPEDLPYLARELLRTNSDKFPSAKSPPTIELDALRILGKYGWPGNVRELENVIVRAAIVAEGNAIGAQHIPSLSALAPATPDGQAPPTLRSLAEVEAEHIAHVLRVLDGNVVAAARTLGVSRTTLYKKLGDRTKSA